MRHIHKKLAHLEIVKTYNKCIQNCIKYIIEYMRVMFSVCIPKCQLPSDTKQIDHLRILPNNLKLLCGIVQRKISLDKSFKNSFDI